MNIEFLLGSNKLSTLQELLSYLKQNGMDYRLSLKTDRLWNPLLCITAKETETKSDEEVNNIAIDALKKFDLESFAILQGGISVIDKDGELVSWIDSSCLEELSDGNKNIDKEKAAFNYYPVEHFGSKGMINAGKRMEFIEGATWRENNPNIQMVVSVLTWLVSKEIISESVMIELSEQYIEEH